ncbi:PD-(D/E)XK nuclease family protein [Brachyspira pilosicoli]|uniref:PD-(D/E)XK nuclease family protein n=1 Tax=Brachyspira pilosicoli TaxID=52584 RepID=UPI000C7873C6|nr:PD-(D/E)XK nuclease family protein [Brachyspira pilosicoli]PLV55235.1 hypothetical protein BPSP16_12210 [Brachyspira pilosicoli SP16]
MNENNCINFLSNFIFYYSQYKNNLLKYLKDFILEKENIINEIDKEKEKLAPKINIINLLEASRIEVPNSFLLFNLFNTSFKENNIEINFAKIFSKYIIEDLCENKKIKNINDIKVYKEFTIPKGRIDILIQSTNFEIIIENKIGADDGDGQLKLYYDNRKKQIDENKIFIVYLTPDGKIPSNKSIDDELREQLKNRICYLSHNNIAIWIDNTLKEYKFLKENDKYQSIYSSLIQIRDNEKIISNSTEEDNMEKDVIKKFLKSNKEIDINNLSDISQLKKLFSDVISVLEDYEKKFFNKILEQLKIYNIKVSYNKIKDYYIGYDIGYIQLHIYLKDSYYIHYQIDKEKYKILQKLENEFGKFNIIKNEDNWYTSQNINIDFFNEDEININDNTSHIKIADEIRKIVQKLENAIK